VITVTAAAQAGSPILEVDGLSAGYTVEGQFIRAVDNVSFTLERGRALGIVGESGSGKSTLALALTRLLPRNGVLEEGRVVLDGAALHAMADETFRREIRWKRLSMVFQSAMNALNPVLRIDRQLRDIYRLHDPKAGPDVVEETIARLCRLVGLDPSRIDGYPHEFSGGMRQRVVIAMGLLSDPDVVIADEATTALDVVVQAQILAELAELRRVLGLAMIVISHDIGVITATCEDVLVMYAGQVVERGPVADVFARPTHPYTAALSAAIPSLTGPRRRLMTLPSDPPDLAAQRVACTFADRCPIAAPVCREEDPPLVTIGEQVAKCHFAGSPDVGAMLGGPA
jgi:oligopeptide/dipeptide ABC transporter ATP-binding protein